MRRIGNIFFMPAQNCRWQGSFISIHFYYLWPSKFNSFKRYKDPEALSSLKCGSYKQIYLHEREAGFSIYCSDHIGRPGV